MANIKRKLEKAPLVYALVQLKTSAIPNLAEKINPIHEKLMELDLIDKVPDTLKRFNFNVSQQGDTSSTKVTELERFLFFNKGRTQCLQISPYDITLKLTHYETSIEMMDLFRSILEICNSVISGFQKLQVDRIGIRYVDVLIPLAKSNIDDYLKDGLLDSFVGEVSWAEPGSIRSERINYIKTNIGTLRAALSESKMVKGRVRLLPPDLSEPENIALNPVIQAHWNDLGNKSYAILDTDHFIEYQQEQRIDLDINTVLETVKSLKTANSDIFWKILTQKALKDYGYTEVNLDD